MKLCWVIIWSSTLYVMVSQIRGCPLPTGMCRLFSFSFLFTPAGKMLLYIVTAIFLLLYLFEKKMAICTTALFFISAVVITVHESNGIFFRATVLTIIWLAQAVAYLQKRKNSDYDIARWRVQYTVQIIAAVYTLAGLAKLHDSGWQWVNAGSYFTVQVMKNYSFLYSDTGSLYFMQKAQTIVGFLLHHNRLLQLMLGLSLALELFCLAAALNERVKAGWGVGLLFMHIGIAYIMGIGLSVICFPMVIYFLNPLYLLLSPILTKNYFSKAG